MHVDSERKAIHVIVPMKKTANKNLKNLTAQVTRVPRLDILLISRDSDIKIIQLIRTMHIAFIYELFPREQ